MVRLERKDLLVCFVCFNMMVVIYYLVTRKIPIDNVQSCLTLEDASVCALQSAGVPPGLTLIL